MVKNKPLRGLPSQVRPLRGLRLRLKRSLPLRVKLNPNLHSSSLKLISSFRDPSGHLFQTNNTLYRQVNRSYQEHYDYLFSSGLYDNLVKDKLLVSHREVELKTTNPEVYKIIQPFKIPFISYPYEWSFSQIKDAALLTLKVQKIALEHRMTLKDAPGFNVQFLNGKPIWIDTLSFEKIKDNKPWVAYRQFCEHFLGPLALMAYKDVRLGRLLSIFLDGIPLDLTSKLLPVRSKLNLSLLVHLHLHASSQRKYNHSFNSKASPKKFSLNSFLGLVDSLNSAVNSLIWEPKGTEWSDYYEKKVSYKDESFKDKIKLVKKFIDQIKPKSVWDIGSNTGLFSQISTEKGIETIAFDVDLAAVEKGYIDAKTRQDSKLLPLFLDLANPTPSLGWENKERYSLFDRGPTDTILALALVHHLAISNNLPFNYISSLFSRLCKNLIVEFIEKDDAQVQKLFRVRKDVFVNYNQNNFESEFGDYFKIKESVKIKNSQRILYLMESKK